MASDLPLRFRFTEAKPLHRLELTDHELDVMIRALDRWAADGGKGTVHALRYQLQLLRK